MGKRTYIKFVKNCQITKVVRKGRPRVYMKCYGKKGVSAQEIIDNLK